MYDLKAIKYGKKVKNALLVGGVYFSWYLMPEGYYYWFRQHEKLTADGKAKLAEMRDQYEREKRPAVGVLHDWDGGSMSPVPVGTDRTVWTSGGGIYRDVSTHLTRWNCVTQYLVHSYPTNDADLSNDEQIEESIRAIIAASNDNAPDRVLAAADWLARIADD